MAKLSTKSALIADTLAEEIIRGEIAPGARLAQDHIAARFETSHVPVREALQRLVKMELASAEPRRGVRALCLSAQDYRDIRDMRLALEPVALRRAVALLDSAAMEAIEVARTACDAADNPTAWERANRRFHHAILRPCDRPLMLRHIEQLQLMAAHRFHARWRKTWAPSTDRDHAAIAHAMKLRDADAACRMLTQHLKR